MEILLICAYLIAFPFQSFQQGQPPTWIANSMIQADTYEIISMLTDSSSAVTVSTTFLSAFSSGRPQIALGISNFEGNKFMDYQKFSIFTQSVTSSMFSTSAQLFGTTTVWVVSMRYFAIDNTFSHKFHIFPNFPLNYSAGALNNISLASPTMATYSNTINYTAQCLASGFNSYLSFSQPYSTNKIVLFISAMFLTGTLETGPTFNALQLSINFNVISSDSYTITAAFGIQAFINRLEFCLFIYDYVDIAGTGIYQLYYQKIAMPSTGTFLAIPIQLQTNSMIGLVEFSTNRTSSILHFNLLFTTNLTTSAFGIYLPACSPIISSTPPVTNLFFQYLIFRNWKCPPSTYFNLSSILCELCTIPNCIVCQSSTLCSQCQSGFHFNPITIACQQNSVCGDMKNFVYQPEECDDGNLENGDGCSSYCKVQSQFICNFVTGPTGFLYSVCYFMGEIKLNVVYMEKVDDQNQIIIYYQLIPTTLKIWASVNFMNVFQITDHTNFAIYSISRSSDGILQVVINYNCDAHRMVIITTFDPSLGNQMLSNQARIQQQVQIFPDDNESAYFYEQNVYQIAKIVKILCYVTESMALLFIVGSIIYCTFFWSAKGGKAKRVILGLQMVSVLQITYISLINLQEINPCFRALANLWLVNGFSIFQFDKKMLFVNQKNADTPRQVKGLTLFPHLYQNINLTLCIIILPMLLGLIGYFIFFLVNKNRSNEQIDKSLQLSKQGLNKNDKTASKAIRSHEQRIPHKYQVVFHNLIYECTFAGIIFCSYAIGISFALQAHCGISHMHKKQQIQVISICEIVLLSIIYATYFILFSRVPQHFNQFCTAFCITKFHRVSKSNSYQTSLPDSPTQFKFQKPIQIQTVSFYCVDLPKYPTLAARIWYNFIFIEKIITGFCLVFLMFNYGGIIFVICLQTLLIFIVIFKRPYTQILHNIRFILNSLVITIIQTIYLSYKATLKNYDKQADINAGNTSNNPNKQSSWIYLPILVTILLLVCVLYNIVLSIYLSQKIQNWLENKNKQREKLGQSCSDYDYVKNLIKLEQNNYRSNTSRKQDLSEQYRSVGSKVEMQQIRKEVKKQIISPQVQDKIFKKYEVNMSIIQEHSKDYSEV